MVYILLVGYRHSLGCRVQKRYARVHARKSQFLAADSNFVYDTCKVQ